MIGLWGGGAREGLIQGHDWNSPRRQFSHLKATHFKEGYLCRDESELSRTQDWNWPLGNPGEGEAGASVVTRAQEGAGKALDNYVLIDRGVQRQEDPTPP